jgi:hypothetical protein
VNGGMADEITPMLHCALQAAGLAGIAFAVLMGLVLALLPRLGLLPFCGIFFLWQIGAVRT